MEKTNTFSKFAVKAVFVLSVTVIVYCLVTATVLSLLDKLVPETLFYTAVGAAFAAIATCFAFYTNKAKAENTKGGITYDAAISPCTTEEK